MVVSRIQAGVVKRLFRPGGPSRACACLLGVVLLPAGMGRAQAGQQEFTEPAAAAQPRATVHGIVKDAVTGEPLSRVLVTVESGNGSAALSDGDGRFEIPGVPTGNTAIEVIKPGFQDAELPEGESSYWSNNRGVPHAVTIAEEMPDLVFAMRPLNAIRGQIELSTGEPAEKITVELMRQGVQDGRAIWQQLSATRSNVDGAFRFGGLTDGVYAIATMPSIDGEGGGRLLESERMPEAANGYARAFYSDAREVAGAARIRLAGGQTALANFTLRQEAFHLVRATVTGPGLDAAGAARPEVVSGANMIALTALSGLEPQVLDSAGHSTRYLARYDARTHTVQAILPDGEYALRVTAFRPSEPVVTHSGDTTSVARILRTENFLSGQADLSVNGRAVTNLRIALGPESPTPLQVIVNRSNAQASPGTVPAGSGVFVSASQAGNGGDVMNVQFASGEVPGTLETASLGPGAYWLHATVAEPGLCEASFTAGGANLAREPLAIGQNGSTAPLTLTLRDDCASLKLSLPASLSAPVSGEAPIYYVYAIPDFDSTAEVRPQQLRAFLTNAATLENLTPGAYRVYTLDHAVDLPYRDPDAMAALNLQGQAVTLSPGASSTLVVEAPEK